MPIRKGDKMLKEKMVERLKKGYSLKLYELNRMSRCDLEEVSKLKGGKSPLPKTVIEKINADREDDYGLCREGYSDELWAYVTMFVNSLLEYSSDGSRRKKNDRDKLFVYKYLTTRKEKYIVLLTMVVGMGYRPHRSIRDVFNKVISRSSYRVENGEGIVIDYEGRTYKESQVESFKRFSNISDKYCRAVVSMSGERVCTDIIPTGEKVKRAPFKSWDVESMDVSTYVKIGLTVGMPPVRKYQNMVYIL